MKKWKSILLLTLSLSFFTASAEQVVRPKYGPQATRLYDSHGYFKAHPAPDYWALSPYYIPLNGVCACSASVLMILNGLRAHLKLTASDQLISQKMMLDKANLQFWNDAIDKKGPEVTLDQLGNTILPKVLKEFAIDAKAEVIHVDGSAKNKEKIRKILIENEKSDRTMILANFLQGELTGDPEGMVGHLAPIGAFDEKKNQVLIMDPDREWYEPYWVSLDTFIKGMNTFEKPAGVNRGILWIH